MPNEKKINFEQGGMNVAWGGVCSSEPPCLMIAIRKQRYTYQNIKKREAFVVNVPDAGRVKEADAFGLVSGEKVDKFKKTGLTAKKSDNVDSTLSFSGFIFLPHCEQ